jgi:hypothetical protein
MLYSSHIIICTMWCMPTGIYNNVHVYSSHIIRLDEKNKACTLLYIPVGIHDTVHIIKWEE